MSGPLVVVGCGFPQLGLLRAARALGVPLVGLDMNPRAVGVPLCDRFIAASTADEDAVVRACREVSAAGITSTGSELSVATVSRAAERLSLPFYADSATIRRCQIKDEMRAAYRAAGLPVPAFALCRSEAEARDFAVAAGLPVVVKPAAGWGQRGVSRVDDVADLPRAFAAADAVSHGGAGVVVEQFVVGNELSVNGWVEDGALVCHAVTDREVFAGSAPLGVMRSEIAPPGLPGDRVERAVEAAARAARALGLTRGPCYTQVCVSMHDTWVLETAARCGGGFDADVTRLVSGVDLYRRLLGVALGLPELEREGPIGEPEPAALVRFVAPPRGTVTRVGGVEAALSLPGVVDAAIYARPGDTLSGLVNAASRVAHVLVTGPSREEAIARADRAEASLCIESAEITE